MFWNVGAAEIQDYKTEFVSEEDKQTHVHQ